MLGLCVQDPQKHARYARRGVGIDKELIKFTPTWLGGAFGAVQADLVIEAALIAREVGKP